MSCTVTLDAPGPPDDLVTVLRPYGWVRFETEHGSAAWLVPAHAAPDRYLLHYIESRHKGDGTELLRAIGEWADRDGLTGSLTCRETLRPFYEKSGWGYGGEFGLPGYCVMWRDPQ